MARILVIDDEAVVREPIAASLCAAGHDAIGFGDGTTALVEIRQEKPDLILLDVRMAGRDGISVLREIRSNPATAVIPVMLLTSSTDKSTVLQAARLGVQGYLLKSSFSLSELIKRVAKLTGTASSGEDTGPAEKACGLEISQTEKPGKSAWPVLLAREETMTRLDAVAGGKALAGVVSQLISVANSPATDLSDVVRVIQSDPVLAARVLQLANAASTGSRRVRSIEDAARNIGVRGIQNMAISIGIVGAFGADETDAMETMQSWQHSYAVADLLNELLQTRNSELESFHHLVGLCHDLGELLVKQHFAKEHAEVSAFAQRHRLPWHEVLAVAVDVRYPDLVDRLLTRIGLPAPIVEAIHAFHEQNAEPTKNMQGLILANLGAHGLLMCGSVRDVVRPVTRKEWDQLEVKKSQQNIDAVAKRNEILTATNILARLTPSQEKQLMTPLLARQAKKVWYVRPEMFVEFDPLGFALALTCDVTVSSDLPEGDAWDEIDAIMLTGAGPGIAPVLPEELFRKAEQAGRADMPILALVERPMTPLVKGSLIVRSYPICLEDLSAWLGAVPVERKKSAAGR